MAQQRPQPRRAAVSSYGLSGTNVHAILGTSTGVPNRCARESHRRIGTAPTAVSAVVHLGRRAAPHRRPAGRLGDAHADDVALPDLAYTLARRRAHRPVRTAVIASEPAGAHRGFARGRRRRHSVSARGRAATTGVRCGCSPARVRSGRRWAPTCWRTNRCSPPPSRRPSR